ncbi:unnamed protein product [Bursaphelenchus okinawaensis]|uniref:Uncharacterized protein n=1 Tax=Bursaphelenchus okinawaensis TaxID=465554 RepID=A0A811KT47_9BILA|nr:unnamed protein product [Bursaphelenchus okinawaensis]CAG9112838.1 unnamed protein product [Bursaphelenchus okinawaensis]
MDSTLQCLITVETVFTLVAFVVSIYVVVKFRNISTLHGNFRLVLSYALVGGNIFNLSHLYLYPRIVEFYKDTTDDDYVTTLDLKVAAILYWAGAAIALTKFLLIGLERFMATTYRKDYEHRGTCIGWTMITVHVTVSVGIGFVHMSAYDMCVTYVEDCEGYCERDCAMAHFFYDGNLMFIAVSYLVGLLCWLFGTVQAITLIRFNKMIGSQLDTLSLRFQYRENLETLKAMLPRVTIYGVMEIVCCSVVVYCVREMQNKSVDSVEKQVLFHITYAAMAGYNLFFSLYNLLGYPPLTVGFVNDLRRIVCMVPIEFGAVVAPKEVKQKLDEKITYFEYVQKQWK